MISLARMAPQVGDLMLRPAGLQREFVREPVYRVEKDPGGHLVLAPLAKNASLASQDFDDVEAEVGAAKTMRSEWTSESEEESDISDEFSDGEEDDLDNVPSVEEAVPFWFFSSSCTAL